MTVVEQVLTGTFADGLGNIVREPNRIDFDPFPYESFAIWILTQMKRWGQIPGDVDYASVARDVFLATDAARLMEEVGMTPPSDPFKSSRRFSRQPLEDLRGAAGQRAGAATSTRRASRTRGDRANPAAH